MGAFSIGLTSSADSGSWDATRAGTVPIVGRGPKHHNITMFSFHWSNRFACTDLERITRAELPVWGVASTCLSKGMSRHLVRVAKRDALFVASRRFLFPITSLTSRLELASHYSREHEHIWRGGCKDIYSIHRLLSCHNGHETNRAHRNTSVLEWRSHFSTVPGL